MTTATVAENVPHLCYRDGRWTVRVKTARGDFTHLTEPTQYKSLAQRDLKNVRAEMVEMFLEKLRSAA